MWAIIGPQDGKDQDQDQDQDQDLSGLDLDPDLDLYPSLARRAGAARNKKPRPGMASRRGSYQLYLVAGRPFDLRDQPLPAGDRLRIHKAPETQIMPK
jgi:hypothetical protein